MDNHLDLGCGLTPKNPYNRSIVHGIDIRTIKSLDFEIKTADLALEPIPYPDSHFDSVSAYDFLEHIPRILQGKNGQLRFPFIDLMDEIFRILKPNGRFYASTPHYPHPEVFQDPTHVNILTRDSHIYFSGPEPLARMYGFKGHFAILRVQSCEGGKFVYEPLRKTRLQQLKNWIRSLRGKSAHLIWEFEANKEA